MFILLFTPALFSAMAFPQELPNLQTPENAEKKNVVDMSIRELLEQYPSELSDLEFADRGELGFLLQQAGKQVEAFFRNFSNTSSKEEVHLQSSDSTGKIQRSAKKEFYYLIFPNESGSEWREDRTDKKGHSIKQDLIPGLCISTGYAHLSLYLHPAYQSGSRFRYLGREIAGTRAHVIAFAQKPEIGLYMVSYTDTSLAATIPFLVQGFVWIDPGNYQILRMRTDMLRPNLILREQITDISYIEVRFEGVEQPFWLPREVKIDWRAPGMNCRNQHLYSDYRLFAVESDYKISKPPGR
jgi:hypothetical protein